MAYDIFLSNNCFAEGNEGRGVEVFKPLNIKKKPTGRLTEDESQKQVQVER